MTSATLETCLIMMFDVGSALCNMKLVVPVLMIDSTGSTVVAFASSLGSWVFEVSAPFSSNIGIMENRMETSI